MSLVWKPPYIHMCNNQHLHGIYNVSTIWRWLNDVKCWGRKREFLWGWLLKTFDWIERSCSRSQNDWMQLELKYSITDLKRFSSKGSKVLKPYNRRFLVTICTPQLCPSASSINITEYKNNDVHFWLCKCQISFSSDVWGKVFKNSVTFSPPKLTFLLSSSQLSTMVDMLQSI